MIKKIETYLLEIGFTKKITSFDEGWWGYDPSRYDEYIKKCSDYKIEITFPKDSAPYTCSIDRYYSLDDTNTIYQDYGEGVNIFDGFVYNFKHLKYILLGIFPSNVCKDIFNLNHEVLI